MFAGRPARGVVGGCQGHFGGGRVVEVNGGAWIFYLFIIFIYFGGWESDLVWSGFICFILFLSVDTCDFFLLICVIIYLRFCI